MKYKALTDIHYEGEKILRPGDEFDLVSIIHGDEKAWIQIQFKNTGDIGRSDCYTDRNIGYAGCQ